MKSIIVKRNYALHYLYSKKICKFFPKNGAYTNMNAFLSIIIPIISVMGAGGLALLFMTQVSKSQNYTPSMIAIRRLIAIGAPLCFSIDLILTIYVHNSVVDFTVFIIEMVIVFILSLNLTIKIKKKEVLTVVNDAFRSFSS